MFGFGPTELFIVLLIIILLFGAKRIPEIARGIGRGIVEFKKATHEGENEIESTEKNVDQSHHKEQEK
ncbi:twin-arginine translocase TatA/TatE family subunit [Candidatus Latescibacterota bacterium]